MKNLEKKVIGGEMLMQRISIMIKNVDLSLCMLSNQMHQISIQYQLELQDDLNKLERKLRLAEKKL